MADLPKCRRTSWAEVDGWADRLTEKILGAGDPPETIVGLTRGGWVAARLLADRLGVRRMVSLRAQHWGVTATKDGKARLSEGLSGGVEDQDVLVVDDITDTGESLKLALDHVRAAGPKRVETATFLHIAHSKFVPSYYAEEIPREAWVWVVFPWNYWEDLRSLVERVGDKSLTAAGIRLALAQGCGLDVPLEDVERVLRKDNVPAAPPPPKRVSTRRSRAS
ncbi:MAG TPA: phosphoribosyltransferase [Thermoplasmata archaeon]|nr:phosphoribosyltransferase [Thermoplasmata archaeon]